MNQPIPKTYAETERRNINQLVEDARKARNLAGIIIVGSGAAVFTIICAVTWLTIHLLASLLP